MRRLSNLLYSPMTLPQSTHPYFFTRWWIYQKERFPLLSHGLLVLVFSSATVVYPALLTRSRPSFHSLLVVFITLFCAFLQLRIADEFKDYDHDCQYRPHRPVPRGLIQLWELQMLELLTLMVQLFANLTLNLHLLPWLCGLWLFQSLMRQEFFAKRWLRQRPLFYLLSHNLVLPLMALYGMMAIAIASSRPALAPMGVFLVLSGVHGMAIEIGRKIRPPQREIPGGESYSQQWGLQTAILVWLGVVLAGGVLNAIAAWFLNLGEVLIPFVLLAAGGLLAVGDRFLKRPTVSGSKLISTVSGVWVMMSYLSLGVVPWFLQR